MKKTIDTRSLHGKDYVQKFESNQPQQRLGRLLKYIDLKESYAVLDCGCGNGMMLPLIEEKVASYTGIDFSPQFIERAKERNQTATCHFEFLCENVINHCHNTPNTYDVVMAMDLSEHIEDAEWNEILNAIKISLKDKGKLYLHTPNGNFFIEKMKAHNFILKQFPEHIAVRNKDENCQIISKSGFPSILVRGLPHYNMLRFLHPLSQLPFIGKWFEARLLITATKQKP